jgi:penicillin-insensitive murein endopeptidase
MLTGHASHQIGLDADIWLRPMPDHELTREDREEMPSTDVRRVKISLMFRPDVWTKGTHGSDPFCCDGAEGSAYLC